MKRMCTVSALPLRMRTALVLTLPAKKHEHKKSCACRCSVIGSFILYLACLWCLGVLICFYLKEVMYNSASYIAILLVMVMNLKPLPLIVTWSSLPSPNLAMQVFTLAYQKKNYTSKIFFRVVWIINCKSEWFQEKKFKIYQYLFLLVCFLRAYLYF